MNTKTNTTDYNPEKRKNESRKKNALEKDKYWCANGPIKCIYEHLLGHNMKSVKQSETKIPGNINMEVLGQEEKKLEAVSKVYIYGDMKN